MPQHIADELNRLNLMRTEWDAWRRICDRLELMHAVTREDLESSPSTRDTDGQKLLALIREWGDALADLKATHR